jgi:hypothetical protein
VAIQVLKWWLGLITWLVQYHSDQI